MQPEIFDRVLVIPGRCEIDFADFDSPRLTIFDPEMNDRRFWCRDHLFRLSGNSDRFPSQVMEGVRRILDTELPFR